MFAAEFALIQLGVIEPTPMPRGRLQRPPIWERVSAAGVRTAVVRLPFTYPADHQANYVISNRVVTDLWDSLGVKPGDRASLVGPPSRAEWLLAELAKTDGIDSELEDQLLPRNERDKPADAVMNPSDVLEKVLAISQQMFSTTERLIRADSDLRVVMLHVTDFDNICHAFWQYRFPEDFGADRPAPADVARLGPVVDRYLEYVDRRIGQLIAAFPEPPNVLIVSDHGEEASPTYPLWKGWHSRIGVFLASGPSVQPAPGSLKVSYYDIAPTILNLLDMEPARDLSGKSLVTKR